MKVMHSKVTGRAEKLSPKEVKLLRYVARSIERSGIQPTYRDIQCYLGYRSINSVRTLVMKLMLRGVIWETTYHGLAFDWAAYLGNKA